MDNINDRNQLTNSDVKILVVDDREDNLFSIETILEPSRYTIVKARSGRAALKALLHQHDFSLILMDVQMPDMNGFETASLIYQREKLRNIPIIFITANDYGEELIFEGYRMGGVDYIYKPVNPDLLRAKVSVFVELYRKTQELMAQEKRLTESNVSLQREIQERKASEEKVRLLNEQLLENNNYLKALNEDLDRFAYVASHDLQEPLRKIMLFSDRILQKNIVDNDVSLYLQKIVSSSKRMENLIDDLLRFSRHNTHPTDFTRIDLNKVVSDVLQDVEVDIEKKKAMVKFNSLPEIWGIPILIHQLFFNLVNNAIKFSKQNVPPEININSELVVENDPSSISRKQQGLRYQRITIKDNGIGFDASYSEEIFRVFKRLNSYHEYNGSGIGLSICKKIVETHNGSISAESVPGQGSTFMIELPEEQLFPR
ncbi:sensor histidine kinase [Flavihumibacter sp.]|uniref:sensor histidine kinase n=1 Tax=Flavihumibacter sp. TaxID=1913981 RepID=UPI002FC7BED6|nr:response regulator [Flavihumibacter sediminis]